MVIKLYQRGRGDKDRHKGSSVAGKLSSTLMHAFTSITKVHGLFKVY